MRGTLYSVFPNVSHVFEIIFTCHVRLRSAQAYILSKNYLKNVTNIWEHTVQKSTKNIIMIFRVFKPFQGFQNFMIFLGNKGSCESTKSSQLCSTMFFGNVLENFWEFLQWLLNFHVYQSWKKNRKFQNFSQKAPINLVKSEIFYYFVMPF